MEDFFIFNIHTLRVDLPASPARRNCLVSEAESARLKRNRQTNHVRFKMEFRFSQIISEEDIIYQEASVKIR